MNFLRKRSQLIPAPPGADHGRVRSMQPQLRVASAWSVVFQRKFKMADEADSSVSGEEGHSGTT